MAASPSLIQRLRRPRRSWPKQRVQALRYAAGAVLVMLATVAVVTGVLAGRARREAITLGETVAQVSAAREADRAAARLFAQPTLGEEMAALAAHLPPETKLASAGMDDRGRLRIAIDSPDPDALRDTLRAEPWFARFRERGQAVGGDGGIRVTLERAP